VDSKFLGVGHFFEFALLGGFCPHLTLAELGPKDPNKNGFCSGAIAPPFGGDIFFSKLWPEILQFLTWSIVPTPCYRFWDFKENLIHVTQINFVQSWKKTRKVTFWDAKGENIQSRGHYNGLMLKFSPGGAVTVRDRPHKVYEVE